MKKTKIYILSILSIILTILIVYQSINIYILKEKIYTINTIKDGYKEGIEYFKNNYLLLKKDNEEKVENKIKTKSIIIDNEITNDLSNENKILLVSIQNYIKNNQLYFKSFIDEIRIPPLYDEKNDNTYVIDLISYKNTNVFHFFLTQTKKDTYIFNNILNISFYDNKYFLSSNSIIKINDIKEYNNTINKYLVDYLKYLNKLVLEKENLNKELLNSFKKQV